MAPVPAGRAAAVAEVVNGILYVAGGHDGTAAVATLEGYNPATNTWSSLAPMPGTRYYSEAAVIDGQLYVVGGWGGGSCCPNNNLWVYDPPTNTWSSKASAPTLTAQGAAGVINGKLYVTTAANGFSGWRNFLHVYDPVTDAWTQLANSPHVHDLPAAGAINGKFYVAGGHDGSRFSGATDVYDPLTNRWTTVDLGAHGFYASASQVINGLLYAVGGYDGTTVVATVEVYDPASNTWTTQASMSTARSSPAAGVVDGVLYAVGGWPTSGPPLATNEAFSTPPPATLTSIAVTPSNPSINVGQTQQFTATGTFSDGTARAFAPGDGLTWASGNTSVATISASGLASAGATAGSSTITATSGSVSGNAVLTVVSPDTTPPTTTAVVSPAANAAGWNKADVTATLTATDNVGGSGVQSLFYASTLTGGPTIGGSVAAATTSLLVVAEGTTSVNYHARDVAGNIEGDRTIVIRLDKTAPTLANIPSQTVSATSTAGAVVTFSISASDSGSGVFTTTSTPLASGATFPHGTTNETVTVVDRAGNSTFRNFTVTVNKTLLSIAVSPSTSTIDIGESQPFQATGHFTSGSDQVLPTSGGGGGTSVPASPTWHLHFSPSLNVNACKSVPDGLSILSQGISPDATGTVNTSWGNGSIVQVNGTVTLQQVNLTLGCIPANGAVGSVSAMWTGTRYEGTATFSGSTNLVSIVGWSTKAPMPTARFAFGATAVNGIVYAMGGGDPSLAQPVDAYDPATNSWSTVSEMPTSREGAGVAALNGKIYVAGGHIAGGVASGVFEVYDPLAKAWNDVLLPAMPTARAHFALVAAGGKLYAIGGDTGSNNSNSTAVVESYDPSTNQWTARAPMSAPRNFLVAGALNNETMIVVAGNSSGGSSIELYDVGTNTWTTGPAMLTPTGGMAAAVVNNALFVFGGFGSSGGLTLAHMFRPAVGQQPAGWAALASMPTGRGELAAAVVGDVIYAIGGQVNGQGIATVEAFSTMPPGDFSLSSGGGGSSSLPTVQWQSTSPSIADINSSGFATGNAPGQTTIVATAAGISCTTTTACATLTVNNPAYITLTLAAGSATFGSVQVTAVHLSTGKSEGPFDVPIGAPQSIDPNQYRLIFTAPSGYTLTPAQVDLDVHAGDVITIPLHFDLIDTTPPILTVSSDLTAEAISSAGAVVAFAAATATDSGSGVESVSCDHASGDTFPLGTTTVNCSAADHAGNTLNASFHITVVDTTPPAVTVPANITAEATLSAGAAVTFSASASDIVDGATAVSCTPASGAIFAPGAATVNCSSTDAHNNTGSGSFTVTVRDTTAPSIASATPSTTSLWPPNHTMVPITVAVRVSDLADAAPVCTIASVSSNEPANGFGDGDTAPDWAVTGGLSLNLRAERAGNGSGRIYTITVKCADHSGNASTTTARVRVAHDQGK